MSPATPDYKAMRRRYLINKRMQIKYAVWIAAVLVIVVLLMQAHTFLVIKMAEPEFGNPLLTAPLKELQRYMLFTGLVYAVVIPILSIFLSHKIAGPLFRLEKTIREALASDGPVRPIKLREEDELQSLADLINQLLARLPQNRKG
jgi:methyl-accepting chemotaxis protein